MDLSIVIPTYKPSDYIKETLESIEKQATSKFEIEVIVVLNGEKEPFLSLLNDIRLPFLYKVMYTDVQGVSNARNIGIENARGKYILFLDDDDVLSDNYINTLLDKATEEDTIYVSNVLCFKDGAKEYYKDYIGNFIAKNSKKKQGRFRLIQYSKLMSSACFKLIPRKVIQGKRFNTGLSISEDALFMFEISGNINKFKICEDVYYYRRVRGDSALKAKKNKIMHLKNYLNFAGALTWVYVKDIPQLNFFLYLNRFMASTKFMFNNILR